MANNFEYAVERENKLHADVQLNIDRNWDDAEEPRIQVVFMII